MAIVELHHFLEVFRSIFNESAAIGENTHFRDLEEWSSMQALIVIATIDENFGVTLQERDFRNANTVKDLHQLTVNG